MDGYRCPLCKHELSSEEYLEVEAKMATQAEEKAEAILQAEKEKMESEANERIRVAKNEASPAQADEMEILKRRVGEMERMNQTLAAEKQTAEAINEKTKMEIQIMKKSFDEYKTKQEAKASWLAGDIGEKALLEKLRKAFPNDRFETEQKGKHEADIVQRISNNDRFLDTVICYDNKEAKKINVTDTTKATQYKTVHDTPHVIIVATVMPSGGNQGITIKDGILIVNQMIITEVAGLIRDFIIKSEAIKMTTHGKSEKESALYEYLCSDTYSTLMDTFVKIADDMATLQQKEERDHTTVWTKRKRMMEEITSMIIRHRTSIDTILQERGMER